VLRLGEIAKALNIELRGVPDTEIARVWPIETATTGDLSFIVLAAQCGLSGSSRLGSWVQLGGQVGTAGHQVIGDLVRVAAKSGVVGDVGPGSVVGGIPAVPIEKWRRGSAGFLRLGDILRRLRRLEKSNGLRTLGKAGAPADEADDPRRQR